MLRYFQNISDGKYQINITDVIGQDSLGTEIAKEIDRLNEYGATDIYEIVNSVGGSVVDGFAIVSANLRSKATIHTFNVGVADSTAGWVVASGDKGYREAYDFASFFLHDPSLDGESLENIKDEKMKKEMMVIKDSIVTIFSNNTGKSKDEISAIMTSTKRMTAKEAKAFGIIDNITKSVKKPLIKENMTALEIMNVCKEHNQSFNPMSNKVKEDEPTWGSVDKKQLPKEAFARNTSENSSEWGYPHHFVVDGGINEDTGRYSSGEFYLHEGGLNAAWAAAMGARTGEKAEQSVISHLKKHRDALGLDSPEDYNKLITMVDTDEEKNNLALIFNINNLQMKNVCKFLNLSESANEDAVISAVTNLSDKLGNAEKELTNLKNDVNAKNEKITSLEEEVKKYRNEAAKVAVKNAISSGKFSEDKEEELTKKAIELGVENFNTFVSMIVTPHVDVTTYIDNKNTGGSVLSKEEKLAKEYQNLAEKNPGELTRIKNFEPKRFEEMFNAWNKF
jgi:ATP-dependent Clp endopeptidase proteolytic subunit ClpP